jgi:hypothetical protein
MLYLLFNKLLHHSDELLLNVAGTVYHILFIVVQIWPTFLTNTSNGQQVRLE